MADKAEAARKHAASFLGIAPEPIDRSADVLQKMEATVAPSNAPFENPKDPGPELYRNVARDAATDAKLKADWEAKKAAYDEYEAARAQGRTKYGPLVQSPFSPSPSAPAAASTATAPAEGEIGPPAAPGPQEPQDQGAAAMPSYTIPAHWQPGTRSMSARAGIEIPQTAKDAAGRAIGLSETAADADMAVARQKAVADVAYQQEVRRANETMGAQQARLDAERDTYVKQQLTKIQQTSDAAHAKVNSDEAWGPAGGARVFAMFLSALAPFSKVAGVMGKEMGSAIDARVQDRIREMEFNSKSARENAVVQGNLLQQNLQAFGSKDKALLATKMNLLDLAKGKLDQAYAEEKTPEAEANYLRMRGELEQRRSKTAEDFAKLEHADVTIQGNEHFVPTQVVGGGAGKAGDPGLFVPTGKDARGNPTGYYAKSEKEAEKARALEVAVEEMQHLYDKSTSTRKKTNVLERAAGATGIVETDDFASLGSDAGQAVLKVKNAEEMGALDKGAAEYGGKIVGNMASVKGSPEKAFGSYLEGLKFKRDAMRRSQAGQSATQVIARDKNGNLGTKAVGGSKQSAPSPLDMPAGSKKIGP